MGLDTNLFENTGRGWERRIDGEKIEPLPSDRVGLITESELVKQSRFVISAALSGNYRLADEERRHQVELAKWVLETTWVPVTDD